MKRREFITLTGGAAASPLAARHARAQIERMPRIAVLMSMAADHPTSLAGPTPAAVPERQ